MTNGPVEFFSVIAYDSTDPSKPPHIMPSHEALYPSIGKIMIQWAAMEQEARLLTTALLELNGKSEPGWQRRDFTKRWKLLTDQFSIFANSEPELIDEMSKVSRLVQASKPVRDGLAHKRTMVGMDYNGAYIKFEIPQKNNPWSKPHYISSFEKASLDIGEATGCLYRLMDADGPTSASLPGKSLLQRLPNMDHLRFPMRPERSRPQKS